MSPKNLTLTDIHGSDPLAKLFIQKWGLSPVGAALFFILVGILYAGILPRLWGYPPWIDGVNLLNIVLVFPAAAYFYVYQPKSILRAYESIARYLREEDDYHLFHLDSIRAKHASPLWWLIGAGFGLMGAGFGVSFSIAHFKEYWYSANGVEIALVQGVRFLAYYCIGVSASRHIATSIELNNLFERSDLPLTVDADRLEIFRSVKNFALEFVGVAAIIALNLGLQPVLITPPMPEYAIYVALYFIVAPVSFFLPLWEAHLRMSRIKNKMLDRLNYDFQEESQRLYRKFGKAAKAASYTKEADSLHRLERAIQTVSRATDWPFQGTTFYRLFVTVVSPFFVVIFEIVINIISNLFVPN
jgi:hypothetical protein